jgi:putative integral membrane protein (TIGR02587 family)
LKKHLKNYRDNREAYPSGNRHNQISWQEEIKDLVSGASGGFLFGIPLLYTMEVWFIGSHVQPPIILSALITIFTIILLLNKIEGFRSQASKNLSEAIAESIETVAIGIVCTGLMLVILRQIDFQTPLTETLGKIIFESAPFSLGVAFSRSLLSGDPNIDLDQDNKKPWETTDNNEIIWRDTLADFIATLMGAVFIAFSIAPTDEVRMLAASSSPLELLILMGASIYMSYNIVFATKFTNYRKRHQQQGLFQTPRSETIISYLISLVAGMIMLWFFQQLSFSDPWFIWLRYSIILGFPASIGGAAGRLAVS